MSENDYAMHEGWNGTSKPLNSAFAALTAKRKAPAEEGLGE